MISEHHDIFRDKDKLLIAKDYSSITLRNVELVMIGLKFSN